MIKILTNKRNLDKKFVRSSVGRVEGDKSSEEEEEKNNTKIYENEKEEENYEFLIPISNNNKLKTFVDRYFLKYYSIYSKEPRLFQPPEEWTTGNESRRSRTEDRRLC